MRKVGLANRSLGLTLLVLVLVVAIPAVAIAGVFALASEAEPNDVVSQANALTTPDVQGTVNSSSDTDDVFSVDLNPYDELEVRVVYDWANATPADMNLALYPPGTSDTFDPGAVENSGSYGIDYLFVRYAPSSGGSPMSYYPDVYAGDTLGQTVSYELDWSVNNANDISGVERYWGEDRYSTALETSYQTFLDGSCTTAVIATGQNFPDALSASGLAGAFSGPLLLTKPDELPRGIDDELARLGVNHVYIVGGASAVSSAVENELSDLGYTVDRIAGADRYQTAAWVAEEVISEWGLGFRSAAFVVRGDSFPDALACAPFAYGQGVPILLTPTDSLHRESEKILDDYNIVEVYIAGGLAAVSSDTQWEIDALNSGATIAYRLGGNNRYQTAAVLANDLVNDHGMNSFTEVGIATGLTFPDALAGGAAAGYRNGVVLLTPGDALDGYAADAMQDNMFQGDDAVVFGGNSAVQTTGAMKDAWDLVLGLP